MFMTNNDTFGLLDMANSKFEIEAIPLVQFGKGKG